MKTNKKKLKEILKEMFQYDRSDLDFGIYRIMNQKREEIESFIEEDLFIEIEKLLEPLKENNAQEKVKEIDEKIEVLKDLNSNGSLDSKIEELSIEKMNYKREVDIDNIESEIYSYITNFFNRYYDEGDFITQRRYKDGVYAIPYEGEEVKLHWANFDQYYVKSSEYFKDYIFEDKNSNKIYFKLLEANTEKENNKNDKKTFQCIIDIDEYNSKFSDDEVKIKSNPEVLDNNLVIYFEYKEDNLNQSSTNPGNKNTRNYKNFEYIKQKIEENKWFDYVKLIKREYKSRFSELEKQLNRYTAKNTYDFFIHKNLEKFLKRELDFYIKNEVLKLEDIDLEDMDKVKLYLIKANIVKEICETIIKFLAQLEEFQKSLWLKKKFVIDINYCLTLDKIDESFYEEICSNEKQEEEWINLYSIDDLEDYKEGLSVDFLENNQYLMVDTRFFTEDFKEHLISSIHNLDKSLDGVLINSDNFHALNLLQKKYGEKIDCVYIDPPYNSPSSEIMYKNNFKDSSWLTLMDNRLDLSKKIVKEKSAHIIAIDKYEMDNLSKLVNQKNPTHNNVIISIEHNKKGTQGHHFSYSNEFAIFSISKLFKYINEKERCESQWEYSNLRNWGSESERKYAKNCFYPIYVQNEKIVGYGRVELDSYHPESNNIQHSSGNIKCYFKGKERVLKADEKNIITAVYPIDDSGVERKWRYAFDSIENIWKYLETNYSRNGNIQIQLAKFSDQYKTLWSDSSYNAGDFGTKVLTNMGIDKSKFQFPKSIYTVQDCINTVQTKKSVILDYFAGSGTTAHAVINLNREDDGNRKYILVEMGEYFNSVTKPRIQKAAYSKEWKDSKPIDREGISQAFKYFSLESYEDSLNNIIFEDENIYDLFSMKRELQREYIISYMLSKETENSKSLLNIDELNDPFNYRMKIVENYEQKEKKIDLIETFNYLIGLGVYKNYITKLYDANLNKDQYGRQVVELVDGNKYKIKLIDGYLPNGDRTLVIWRNITDDLEKDNLVLNRFLTNEVEDIYDVIYVNGDNFIKNLKKFATTRIEIIEKIMKEKMFEDVSI